MAKDSVEPLRLEDFHVSEKTGFMLEEPLTELPAYFDMWNYMASSLPELLETRTLRQQVNQMPLLDTDRLIGYRQQRLAHLQLSLIGAGYVWQDGEKGAPKSLPVSLAVPWCNLSDALGIPPILCHPDLALANWRPIDPDKPLDVVNITCIYNLPGGEASRWFCAVTCAVELTFAKALKPLLAALEATKTSNVEDLKESLRQIIEVVKEMHQVLSRMHDHLPADVFFNTVRPYLMGWGGIGNALPEGIIYTGYSDKPRQCIGGSAAQSSTLQVLDALLGVKHSPEREEFLAKMTAYMPPSHARFVDAVRNYPHPVSKLVEKSKEASLRETYNACLEAVANFRSYHMQIVTKYIIIPASKESRNRDFESLETKGTGGSNLMPFLKDLREKTVARKFP